LTLEEVADRCHAPEDVHTLSLFISSSIMCTTLFIKNHQSSITFFTCMQIEMIYKIIAHMAANDRALIVEGSCGSPRSIKVFLGECNIDGLYA